MKEWMKALPSWLEVRKADISVFNPQRKLHEGEREAFALALSLKAGVVLIDDKHAVLEAKRLNLQTISLFTILNRNTATSVH